MENNYYIPDVSDLHVGFEGEVNMGIDGNLAWYDFNINNPYQIPEYSEFLKGERIRVSYLNNEQILNESKKFTGMSLSTNSPDDAQIKIFWNEYVSVDYYSQSHIITIYSEDNKVIYNGLCRCVNDLRRIYKLIRPYVGLTSKY